MSKLNAVLSDRTRTMFDKDTDRLFEWIEMFGSPVLVMLPDEFLSNINRFLSVFSEAEIDGRILYAAKVNKSEALLDVAAARGIGVDVASLQELQVALAHGVPGHSIGVSGPRKDPALLALAVRVGATVAVDSLEEVKELARLQSEFDSTGRAPVLIRLSGFPIVGSNEGHGEGESRDRSRFGVAPEAANEMLSHFHHPEIKSSVEFVGFSFHFDNHELIDRAKAILTCLKWGLAARAQGLPFRLINSGGGIPAEYIQRSNWRDFVAASVTAMESRDSSFAFRERDFGFRRETSGYTRGVIYPHDLETYGADFLEKLLAYCSSEGESISTLLRRHSVTLAIEPGRSLLDQAGVTLCAIKDIKRTAAGETLLVCNMNLSHMWDQLIGSEFMVDPIVIRQHDNSRGDSKPAKASIVGNLCLESDVLAWRRIDFDCTPAPGDLLAFVNTAGYQMDFIESRIHRLPTPARLVARPVGGVWEWARDEAFSAACMKISSAAFPGMRGL
jgi:diaminopimelate decarboxylase